MLKLDLLPSLVDLGLSWILSLKQSWFSGKWQWSISTTYFPHCPFSICFNTDLNDWTENGKNLWVDSCGWGLMTKVVKNYSNHFQELYAMYRIHDYPPTNDIHTCHMCIHVLYSIYTPIYSTVIMQQYWYGVTELCIAHVHNRFLPHLPSFWAAWEPGFQSLVASCDDWARRDSWSERFGLDDLGGWIWNSKHLLLPDCITNGWWPIKRLVQCFLVLA